VARWVTADVDDARWLLQSIAEQSARLANETLIKWEGQRVPENAGWPNYLIAGEFLPAQYEQLFGRDRSSADNSECARFVAAVMRIVTGKPYTAATAVRAMKDVAAEFRGKRYDPTHRKKPKPAGRKGRT
jgi:hypothetical protein